MAEEKLPEFEYERQAMAGEEMPDGLRNTMRVDERSAMYGLELMVSRLYVKTGMRNTGRSMIRAGT